MIFKAVGILVESAMCSTESCPIYQLGAVPIEDWSRRAAAPRGETQGQARVLAACRSAIASLSKDALGRDEQGGWFYRDELLANIDKALAAPQSTERCANKAKET